MITLLHHTHLSLPHYDSSEWDWLRGALATVDRNYGILNKVFHHIADTHVLHHLISSIPHYEARKPSGTLIRNGPDREGFLPNRMDDKSFVMAMYPWFAMGHLTTYLHLSNKLAERGHKIYFFVPSKTLHKLEQFNLHPDLIIFVPITVPRVEGLPPGAETTADITYSMQPNLMTAMDMTHPIIEASLRQLKPRFVFFDFIHWLPSMARSLGIKTICYCTVSSAVTAYLRRERGTLKNIQLTETGLMEPPEGFPLASMIRLYAHEARQMIDQGGREFGKNISFFERILSSYNECDAIAFKTCRELEGPYWHIHPWVALLLIAAMGLCRRVWSMNANWYYYQV